MRLDLARSRCRRRSADDDSSAKASEQLRELLAQQRLVLGNNGTGVWHSRYRTQDQSVFLAGQFWIASRLRCRDPLPRAR